jgi:hypothetical protein
MTLKRLLAMGGVGAGAALVLYALLSRESDDEKIRRHLDELELAVQVDGEGENPVMRATRLDKRFSELFDEKVRISIPELTSARSGRKDLVALATRAGVWFRTLEIDFKDIGIKTGNIGAQVSTTASLTTSRAGAGLQRDERKVDFTFTKTDGDWRIDSVHVSPKDEEDPEE